MFMSLLKTLFSSPKTLMSKKASRFWMWALAADCLAMLAAKKAGGVVAVDLNPLLFDVQKKIQRSTVYVIKLILFKQACSRL